MKDYLHWSLRQLYLLYFWPTQFEREIEDRHLGGLRLRFKERTIYMLKMLPWMVFINVFANLIIG
ncbi:MAG: hypothetical protein M3Q76_00510, partial [Acidobacteriota bacterium]|nr:hypothetical protein [Acidobacteriota bacterium]